MVWQGYKSQHFTVLSMQGIQAGQAVAELAKQLYLFSQVELEGFIMPDIDQDQRVVGRPNQGLIRKLEIFSSGSAPGHKQTQHAPADSRCSAWFSSMKTRNDFLFLFGPSNNDNGWSNELFIKQTYDRHQFYYY